MCVYIWELEIVYVRLIFTLPCVLLMFSSLYDEIWHPLFTLFLIIFE